MRTLSEEQIRRYHRHIILPKVGSRGQRKLLNARVLIVGAGINGIGTFRDLALNGVDVLLVDRGDFCSGASAASSPISAIGC